MKVPMSTGTRSREAPSCVATPSPTIASSDRLMEAATSVPIERPDGQGVVGAETTEPAEAVHRGEGVADGQRVGDGLRRERQFEQGVPGGAQVARREQLELHGREAVVRADLDRHRRRHPPPVEGPEDGADALELGGLRGEHPQRDPDEREPDDDAGSGPRLAQRATQSPTARVGWRHGGPVVGAACDDDPVGARAHRAPVACGDVGSLGRRASWARRR